MSRIVESSGCHASLLVHCCSLVHAVGWPPAQAANLLAHAPDVFACGVARTGAFNRTLTPFGFQVRETRVGKDRGVCLAGFWKTRV